MSGEFGSRKYSHSTKSEQIPQILMKLSFRELCDLKFVSFDNKAILWVKNRPKTERCEFMRPIFEAIFVTLTENLSVKKKWHPRTLKTFTSPEIAVGTLPCMTGHQNYPAIFTCWWRSHLVATSSFGLLTIRWLNATRKHVFLYPQGDLSGLGKPKNDMHQD